MTLPERRRDKDPFLGKIHIVMIGAFVHQLQGTVDIVLDAHLFWRQPERAHGTFLHVPWLQPDGSVKDPGERAGISDLPPSST